MNERLSQGQVIERYVVEEKLGSGGMATVWLLRHRTLGTQHALKVLTNIGANAELRLMLEGRVQAALRHPNVVAVTDILDVAGSPGLLMEYVPPPSLAVWLAMHQPSVEEAESLFRGIVDGVRHAHRYGLVHRDLKPSNVLLARYDDEGLVPKVADFGLAKVLSEDAAAGHTRSGLTMGTPQYMAPEQIRDAKKVDRRADMFSLGCILYELLAGRPPYAWSDFITLYNQLHARDYPALPAHVPLRLVEAVNGLLEPERDERIPDCDTLLAVLDGRGLPASPTVTPENLGRMVDVPVLRDRVAPLGANAPRAANTPLRLPPPDTATFAGSPGLGGGTLAAAPTLAADPTFLDAEPLGSSPRPVPMPTLQPPAPTMVPGSLEPVSVPPALREPRPRSSAPVAISVVLALGAVGLVGGIGWRMATSGEPPEPPPAPALVSSPAPKPEPPSPEAAALPGGGSEAAPPVVPAPLVRPATPRPSTSNAGTRPASPSATTAPAGAPVPPAATSPSAPEPIAPVSAPEAAAPSLAHIKLDGKGGASRVELVGPAGRFPLPGDVPPGSYEVYAWFPDAPQTKTSRLTVKAGDSPTLLCLSFSMSCKPL